MTFTSSGSRGARTALSALCLALLAACGGGESEQPTSAAPAAAPTSLAQPVVWPSERLANQPEAVRQALSAARARPSFHMLPMTLPEPVAGPGANLEVQTVPVSAQMLRAGTARLTVSALAQRQQQQLLAASDTTERVAPMAARVYTPGQIRAAYGLPALPTSYSGLTAEQRAALGAGQTIYIVDAFHNPNALADLQAFSAQFGLPSCTQVTVSAATALPLPAPGAGCEFVPVYVKQGGERTDTPPAYDEGWAGEIALDLQWAHAIAPLARLVLVSGENDMLLTLADAVYLTQLMGPGVVSMSFGAQENIWAPFLEASFSGPGMSYFAATGDWGSQAMWPSVSPSVVGVGGTSLQWSAGAARTETVWTSTGGAPSLYFDTPSYQNGLMLPGQTALSKRTVADVALNADPQTGHYVRFTPQGGIAGWYSFGGTSASAPQWAAMLGVVNALRVQAGSNALSGTALHEAVYAAVRGDASAYGAAFLDVTSGSNGACTVCAAQAGYDVPTGVGTPNFEALKTQLLARGDNHAPSVSGLQSQVQATLGRAVDILVLAEDVDGDTLTLEAPVKPDWLSVTADATALPFTATKGGVLKASNQTVVRKADSAFATWRIAGTPTAAGSFPLKLVVTDSKGASTTVEATFVVSQLNRTPVVAPLSLSVRHGTPLTATLSATDPDGDALSFSLTSAPAGMAIDTRGVLTWAKPLKGTYSVGVVAQDAKGASGSGTVNLEVTAPNRIPVPPQSPTFTAYTGYALAADVPFTDPDGDTLNYALSGAPAGMTINAATGRISWPKPRAGSWVFYVKAFDSATTWAGVKVTVNVGPAYAPTVAALSGRGTEGTAFTMLVPARDANNDLTSFSMENGPAGMTIDAKTGRLSWAQPVAGTYVFTVVARDSVGLEGRGTVTVTIQPVNLPPVVTVPSTTSSAAVGVAWQFQASATDPNGDAIAWKLFKAPAGMTVSENGLVYWAQPVRGIWTFWVQATDARGATRSVQVTLTVRVLTDF